MKWQAVVILFAIAVSIAVPPALSLTVDQDKQVAIGVLDVCHSAAPSLFSNGDMPGVSECFCRPVYRTRIKTGERAIFLFTPLLFAFQDERPPKN